MFCFLSSLFLFPSRARAGLFPEHPFSSEAKGTAAVSFLKNPSSARFASMAYGGITLYGPDAVFLNPAGLSRFGADSGAVAVSYEKLIEDISRTSAAFSSGNFSAGLLYQNYGSGIYGFDAADVYSGNTLNAYDAAFFLSAARHAEYGDMGLTVKYITSRLADSRADGVAADAGFILFRDSPVKADIAVALRNFGPPLKYENGEDYLPFEAGVGAHWYSYAYKNDIILEARFPVDNSPYGIFAVEHLLYGDKDISFVVRAGYSSKNYSDLDLMACLAGGFGFRLDSFSLDYAYTPYGDLGNAHRISLSWIWGKRYEPKREGAEEYYLKREKEISQKTMNSGGRVSSYRFR